MQEYYKNEKNNDELQWGGTGVVGQGSGVVSWIDPDDDDNSDEGKLPEPEFVDPEIIDRLQPKADSSLRSSAHGLLLADADGMLFGCNQLCGEVPALLVVIETEEEYEDLRSSHASCIQINLEYSKRNPLVLEPEKTLKYELWPVDRPMPEALLPVPASS